MNGLELEDLRWAGAGTYAIIPGRLRVEPGAVGVVVAEPAAGSALADVLTGMSRPLHGTVLLHGAPVTGLPAGECPVALVPCGGGLLPHLTVEGNAGFGLAGRVPRFTRQRVVREVLDRLQLESVRRQRPPEISPVQRLRAAVARALCAGAGAVVVEDRRGQFPCRAAVMTAAAQDLPVLVITDDPRRAEVLGAAVEATCQPVPSASGASREAAHQPAVL
jgi:ABC-type thiamine transport system ATPase subunit